MAAQRGHIRLRLATSDEVSHQLLPLRMHHRLGDGRMGLQAVFNLTQLNAEAANLHLVVRAAEEFDTAVSSDTLPHPP
jgi:hypothetical protein